MPKKDNKYRNQVTHYGEGKNTLCRSSSLYPIVSTDTIKVNCKTCLRMPSMTQQTSQPGDYIGPQDPMCWHEKAKD